MTCADDGSLYEWDISNYGHRSNEIVIKSCSYNDVILTEEEPAKGKKGSRGDQQHPELVTYAVGSDKTIKEVIIKSEIIHPIGCCILRTYLRGSFQISNSTLLREIDLHTLTLSSVALSCDRRMLFTGSTGGRIQSFKFPLTLPGEWVEQQMHGDAVTQMKLSFDNKRLITAGR